jgi:hypothetical protein
MAEFNLSNSTTTNMANTVPDFIVDAMKLDVANAGEETYVYYEKATENYGYYFNHSTVSSPINSLATWGFGKGWTTEDVTMQVILKKIKGDGKDTFDEIIWNQEVNKLIQGDSFAEIIRNPNGTLVNLIPKSPERVKTVYDGARIKRYEIWNGKKWIKKKLSEVFHLRNKRIGDQTRGTSLVQSNKKFNDALIEAFEDERIIKHRDKALGVVYYKTNNTGKIAYANSQIEAAVKNGEMVGLPEDTAKIEPYPSKSSEDRQSWLSYVENLGYQTGQVPRSIVTSDGTSEVGGINGHLIFEVIYGKEALDMENQLWSQVAIKIKFNRPTSLAPKTQENAEKNTGQTAIQPSEVAPSLNR